MYITTCISKTFVLYVLVLLLVLYASGALAKKIIPNADAYSELGQWVVDPTDFGSDLPPVGRSLFDYLVTEPLTKETVPGGKGDKLVYNVPFPFEKLIEKLDAQLAKDALYPLTVKQVLVPLGRSLARNHASPDFFEYPRVVAVADTEPLMSENESGIYFKDRLYIGYGEKSEILEVISYNEKAGRFEFQVIEDYKPGGEPKVFYTQRSVCMSCHQNAAPIFSRQTWGETNANPHIAKLLKKENKEFYGVSIDNGIDIPFAIEEASDRANYFSYAQLLWQKGCRDQNNMSNEIRCRANAFKAALRYRLSGKQGYDYLSRDFQAETISKIKQQWERLWPKGLLMPDSDIPNRDPLLTYEGDRKLATVALLDKSANHVLKELLTVSNIPIELEPLNPRPPLERWKYFERTQFDKFITTLSEFMSAVDVHRLDNRLVSLARNAAATIDAKHMENNNYKSNCEFIVKRLDIEKLRINFNCLNSENENNKIALIGRVYIRNGLMSKGSIDKILFPDEYQIRDINIDSAKINTGEGGAVVTLNLSKNGLLARRIDGEGISKVIFDLPFLLAGDASHILKESNKKRFQGKVSLVMLNDAAILDNAVSEMVLDAEQGKIDSFDTKPIRRVSLMSNLFDRLGMRKIKWCCEDDEKMPIPMQQ